MDNRRMFRKLSRLRTSDLMVAKMGCTRRVALFKSLKLGLLGLLGIFVGHIAQSLFTTKVISTMDYISIPLAVYCVIGYLILDAFESSSNAQKELICDLLALRMNNSGKKS